MTIEKLTVCDNIRQKLEALAMVPLANIGLIHGKTWRPFFTEISGLSVGRVAQGNLDKVRPSTFKRMQESALAWFYEQGQKRGWTEGDCSAQMDAVPKKHDGQPGSWAAWIKGMECHDFIHFPLTIALALKADELFQSLIEACNHNDIESFKRSVSSHQEGSNQASLIGPAGLTTKPYSQDADWNTISDWNEIGATLSNRLEYVLLDIFTGLDVEWGCQYFSVMNPAPLFLWIAPRINENWDIQSGPIPSKNLIYRPVRRLLEFSHAVVHRHYRKYWPPEPVGRSELGKALELSDANVGNHFDGTRKLTISAYDTYWQALCRYLSPAHNSPEDNPICPTPLGVMAIVWQETMIVSTSDSKLKSFVILDEDEYLRRWECHRRNWASLPPSGDMDWPEWLLNQSVSSDSFRSSQSSGLSSSPRECQYSS